MTKTILDVCCGSRMFWFDKSDERAVFCDKRKEHHTLNDKSQKTGKRDLVVVPDILSDFSNLPFPKNQFELVVFDPPHFEKNGEIRAGFSECFRVLRPGGVLIFKWCEVEIPLSEILKLTSETPVIGHKSGKQSLTHWVTFAKASL